MQRTAVRKHHNAIDGSLSGDNSGLAVSAFERILYVRGRRRGAGAEDRLAARRFDAVADIVGDPRAASFPHSRSPTIVRILGALIWSNDAVVSWTPNEWVVVTQIRLPRIILAVMSGMGLGLAGAVLQGLFRNPLVGRHHRRISWRSVRRCILNSSGSERTRHRVRRRLGGTFGARHLLHACGWKQHPDARSHRADHQRIFWRRSGRHLIRRRSGSAAAQHRVLAAWQLCERQLVL